MSIPEYVVIRSERKTLSMKVTPGGAVEVRAPIRCPKREIERFVGANSDWIEKRLRQAAELRKTAEDSGLLTDAEIRALAASMKKLLPEKLDRYSAMLGVEYGRVTVRRQRSKWGSCSSKGNLNFNCLLMLAPETVLDYVVVHELCHIIHPDHSKAFWTEVGSIMPGWKTQRAWLKKNGAVLMARAFRAE